MIMSGLIKPSTQRHAARRTRNPAINPNAVSGGGICGGGKKGEGLFISSYHEDKKHKYRQQRNERFKKWVMYAMLGVAVFAMVSRSGSSESNDKTGDNLLRANPPAAKEAVAAAVPKEALTLAVVQEPALKPKAPYCTLVDADESVPVNVEKPGVNQRICGRKIPINIFEEAKKPTPALGPNVPASEQKEALLLKKETYAPTFKILGDNLNSFFHAYDYAHDKKMQLYMTEDSWAVSLLLPLFFAPSSQQEHDIFLSNMKEALGINIVKNEQAVTATGLKIHEQNDIMMALFYYHKSLEASRIRDHRTVLLRKLFLHPSLGGKSNVCSTIGGLLGKDKDKKYTVIHIADPGQRGFLSKLNELTGKDHRAATEMQPDYVKNILKQTDMMKQDIYPIDSSDTPDDAVHTRLANDPELTGQLKCLRDKRLEPMGGKIYLAVLADVYLGNPTDQTSMWIARMRYALGMKNTFIFTEKKGDKWVSYMNDDYLDLYTTGKLGPWMG